jgi:hypothetical protein
MRILRRFLARVIAHPRLHLLRGLYQLSLKLVLLLVL